MAGHVWERNIHVFTVLVENIKTLKLKDYIKTDIMKKKIECVDKIKLAEGRVS